MTLHDILGFVLLGFIIVVFGLFVFVTWALEDSSK